jgi:hypothetical protein
MEQQILCTPFPNSSGEQNDLPKWEVDENESKSETCVICIDKFSKGEQITGLPNCVHHFHGNCINAWLQGSNVCLLCRAKAR